MNDHLQALPAGHCLGEYRIECVLGSGGFGITYHATNIDPYEISNNPVAIKEYFPNEFALRVGTSIVKPKSTDEQDNYRWGLQRFLEEARTLACFKHPHINEVYRCFEDNGTAYMALEYVDGETLSQILRREGRLDAARLRRLLEELLSCLDEVHKAGFVHRDIKPGNIMFRYSQDDYWNGTAVLLDFGSARQAIGRRSKSITSILTPGYAPLEQYSSKGDNVGPWTDLYALGMVAYRCIAGIGDGDLPDAVERALLDRKGESSKSLAPAKELGKSLYGTALLQAVDWAIQVDENQRPQNVTAMQAALAGKDGPGKTKVEVTLLQKNKKSPSRKGKEAKLPRGRKKHKQEKARRPGEKFRDSEHSPEMVVVPAGSYMMGSPSSEEGRSCAEGPQHCVTIAQPFAVGKYAVTQGEFSHFVLATGYGDLSIRSVLENNWFGKDRRDLVGWLDARPVVSVSWQNAQAYIKWLSEMTGKMYRLLSESEWEYAARAGTTGPFYFGDTISPDQANYDGSYNYGSGSKGVFRAMRVAVGSFPGNDFGLYDMHGNVLEWVEDCWHENYLGAPSDESAWTTGGNCSKRVLRGGSWYAEPQCLRSANRGCWRHDSAGDWWEDGETGFRVARTLIL